MSVRWRSATVIGFAIAMAYLEAAVVVYLQRALDITPEHLFPLRGPDLVGDLAAIEVAASSRRWSCSWGSVPGRADLAGAMAWTAVAFGVWDIFYYAWLWVFVGWPDSPATWDVLFLIPVPWTGACLGASDSECGLDQLWACGSAPARRWQPGTRRSFEPSPGGDWRMLVVLSFTLDAADIMAGRMPGWYPWPVFAAGMVLAAWGAGPRPGPKRCLGSRRPKLTCGLEGRLATADN